MHGTSYLNGSIGVGRGSFYAAAFTKIGMSCKALYYLGKLLLIYMPIKSFITIYLWLIL